MTDINEKLIHIKCIKGNAYQWIPTKINVILIETVINF